MPTATTTIIQGSKEYLYVDITADQALDDQPVEVAVTTARPAVDSWQAATWVGDVGTSRSARILLDGLLTVGAYTVWVRLTDNPEVPILNAGRLKIA